MATPEDDVEKGLFEQDPHVDQLRPEPSAPPSDVVILEGLAGKSDREGWARLYFNRTLTYYAEFRREDIVFTEAIPPDQAPMVGLKATRVGIKKDAVIEYTHTTRAKPGDEFDLDVQLATGPENLGAPIRAGSFHISCGDDCPLTGTCQTRCRQWTCPTGATHCNQTCVTCQTQCDQNTCHTCPTHCAQAGCPTHVACTHVFTCRPGCREDF